MMEKKSSDDDNNNNDYNNVEESAERASIIYGHTNRSLWCTSKHEGNGNESDKINFIEVTPNSNAQVKKNNWLDILQINPKEFWPKKYRYTREPTPGLLQRFTVKERDFYEKNGYIIIKNIIPKYLIDNLKKITTHKHFIHHENSVIGEYIKKPQFLKYIEGVIGPDIMIMNSYIEYGSSSSKLYQDLYCLPFRPADKIVCSFTASEAINGFQFIPSSHRASVLETTNTDMNGLTIQMIYEPLISYQTLESKGKKRETTNLLPGDTVLYHPLLYHNFMHNKSTGNIGIKCHFASSECNYVSMSNSYLHDFISPRMADLVKLKSTFNDEKLLWQKNGLLLKGKQINL